MSISFPLLSVRLCILRVAKLLLYHNLDSLVWSPLQAVYTSLTEPIPNSLFVFGPVNLVGCFFVAEQTRMEADAFSPFSFFGVKLVLNSDERPLCPSPLGGSTAQLKQQQQTNRPRWRKYFNSFMSLTFRFITIICIYIKILKIAGSLFRVLGLANSLITFTDLNVAQVFWTLCIFCAFRLCISSVFLSSI